MQMQRSRIEEISARACDSVRAWRLARARAYVRSRECCMWSGIPRMYARALCMHSGAPAWIRYIDLGACYARRVKLRHCRTELILDRRSSISMQQR